MGDLQQEFRSVCGDISEDTILPPELEDKIDLPNEPDKETDSELAPYISEPPPSKASYSLIQLICL